MNADHTDIQNLIQLKRYESPSDEYFEEFLEEFHQRQREELLKSSARSLLVERMGVWFKELGMAKWAYGAGVGYATLMLAFFAWPRGNDALGAPPLQPVDHQKPLVEDVEEEVSLPGNF